MPRKPDTPKENDALPKREADRARDEALKRMLKTPPKPRGTASGRNKTKS
jgi:hypothetical protein